jgi:putative flippase GtrA
VSWVVSVFNAFYWNNKYVFKNEAYWLKSLLKTYVSYGAAFLIGSALLYIFVDVCSVSKNIAPLLILIVSIPLNFFMNKFWTFK